MRSKEDADGAIEYDPERGVYRTYFEEGRDVPSIVIVETIAEIKAIDPFAMEPLGNTIDMNAIDEIIQASIDGHPLQTTFSVEGYQVTIQSEGVIELRRIDARGEDGHVE